MKFQANGIIKLVDGTELKDPFMEIMAINYDYKLHTFDMVCDFYEIHNRHQRSFKNPKEIIGLVQTQDVLDFISNDEFLSQFSVVE